MSLYGNASLTGTETTFERDEIIVSKTDVTGKLIYGNRLFFKMAELSEKECIGQQHNIVRHPEMPRTVFDLLWETIKSGKEIFAYVNNRSKTGNNYWVYAHVTPSFDRDGTITGYHSNRRKPERKIVDERIIPLYRDLLKTEQAAASPKQALRDGRKVIQDILSDSRMGFNQLMFSLGGG
ncbi:PAS domain-containing protein [Denitrobaculum tricleocarpae]|uniref:PAS domain-containing protein n=1 Tax=Denitrobaculum tricleocarpae TaxID=2591009 RepID=UPI001FE8087B|nr:PAS domain-containing protein [Denitrobaculum tricleocarpae]